VLLYTLIPITTKPNELSRFQRWWKRLMATKDGDGGGGGGDDDDVDDAQFPVGAQKTETPL